VAFELLWNMSTLVSQLAMSQDVLVFQRAFQRNVELIGFESPVGKICQLWSLPRTWLCDHPSLFGFQEEEARRACDGTATLMIGGV
jgi:hypothetical protein